MQCNSRCRNWRSPACNSFGQRSDIEWTCREPQPRPMSPSIHLWREWAESSSAIAMSIRRPNGTLWQLMRRQPGSSGMSVSSWRRSEQRIYSTLRGLFEISLFRDLVNFPQVQVLWDFSVSGSGEFPTGSATEPLVTFTRRCSVHLESSLCT